MAALSAGADAIYCGLKHFSARMEAKNFTIPELAHLIRLAHRYNAQVYITLNSLVKPDEIEAAADLVHKLTHQVQPDGLIIQDMAFLELARQIGFKGQLHLSTLANVTFPSALTWIKEKLGITRVVIPRELSVDEIKMMAANCPKDLNLEAFIHGALCYGVSGRCYWSSWFGGKSGLRGRCVQPCRRLYQHRKERQRYFSCQDLSIDVLAKVLKGITAVGVWKIEGRKKGPHYVYYTVRAYRLLRDHHNEAPRKRDALALLEHSLGRHSTHYNFLSQRPQNPINADHQTGSGLFLGRIQGGSKKAFVSPRLALLPGDMLRIGYEDQPQHTVQRVRGHVPKKGRFYLKIPSAAGNLKGTPVFLTDRREKALDQMIVKLEKELDEIVLTEEAIPAPKKVKISLHHQKKTKEKTRKITVFRDYNSQRISKNMGLWLSETTLKHSPKPLARRIWWWLPPVIWPDNQEAIKNNIEKALSLNGHTFVLNAPWQLSLFPATQQLNLWAGPFCNITNPLSIQILNRVGFRGVIVSPELGKADYELLACNASLPLGIVLSGYWPLCVSRVIDGNISLAEPFKSPKGETAWVQFHGGNYWVFANWPLDISSKRTWLEKLGFTLFIHLNESIPSKVKVKERPGLWNWELGLR
jgi:putative protease